MNYTVQDGDTLTAIARRFGVSIAKIASDNGIDDPNYIQSGQVLTIVQPVPAATVNQRGEVLGPVTLTAQRVPVPASHAGLSLDLGDWLKPPKVFYVLAASAALMWLFGQGKRR